MGKLWIVGAAVLLGWVIISMYFVVSGAPLDLPPEMMTTLPYFVVVLLTGIIFFRFRKTTGNLSLDRANLWAVLSGSFLVALLGCALITVGRDSRQALNWLYTAIAWSPVAIYLILRYRNLRRDADKNDPYLR